MITNIVTSLFILTLIDWSSGFNLKTVNIAFEQFTKQSTTFEQHISNFTVNGIFDPRFKPNVCSQTTTEQNPWLIVQFEKAYIIQAMRLLNRNNNHHEKLNNLSIKTKLSRDISITNFESFQLFNFIEKFLVSSGSKSFKCKTKPHYATTVLFYINTLNPLTLCQIEMWNLKNLAKHKVATSSSFIGNGYPRNGVDDLVCAIFNVDGIACTHTSLENLPWWKVDLANETIVYAISMIGDLERPGRSMNAYISVTENSTIPVLNMPILCASFNDILPNYSTVRCPKLTIGRYVSIILNANTVLTVCEVDVFGANTNDIIMIYSIFVNGTDYHHLNTRFVKDCNGHIKATTNILKENINHFRIEIKGVGIENICQKYNIMPVTTFQIGDRKYDEFCKLTNVNNGYFIERDMYDKCSYSCTCKSHLCHSISLYDISKFESLVKEIFVFLYPN
ncbi:unnamed protein product [Dimorphilus gyrociliatus]|uniref:Fucolectin tachylectin-4 pentraxin-1 domain-containing protein n=1 Tax=Dimorphilus gyrociliatus TaxID=2664684 RepID=A0A7I8WEJ4_9ANNE|nr:unnamed protein product [Dimorphilus gyrociliatus]